MVRFASFLLFGVIAFGTIAGCEKTTAIPSNTGPAPKGANLQDFSDHNDAPPPPPPRRRG